MEGLPHLVVSGPPTPPPPEPHTHSSELRLLPESAGTNNAPTHP